MSVPEQVPYKEYRATGSNNSFEITFYLPDQKDLVVMVNKEIPLVGAYSIQGNTVVFSTPPNEGDLVELTRDTQLDRETNFKSYDNSFRPETINFDLDKIWLVLQESNLVDAKILARLKQEIEWRRTHDFNYDELAQVREKQLFDALKGYTDTLLASTNPGVFQGVIAGVVFARDGKSIQTHIEEILNNLELNRSYIDEQVGLMAPQATTYNKVEVDTKINAEATRAQVAEQVLQDQVNAVGVGNKAYKTYALMDADKTNIPAESKVTVTNDETTSNNGDWQWDGVVFTKSAYDPVTQSKNYTDVKTDFWQVESGMTIQSFDAFSEHSVGFIGQNGKMPLGIKKDGTVVSDKFTANNVIAENLTINQLQMPNFQVQTLNPISGFSWGVVGNNNKMPIGIRNSGAVHIDKLTVKSIDIETSNASMYKKSSQEWWIHPVHTYTEKPYPRVISGVYGEDGSILVGEYVIGQGVTKQFKVGQSTVIDDHDAPCVWHKEGRRAIVMWQHHDRTQHLLARTSTRDGDISTLEYAPTQQISSGGDNISYTQLHYLESESTASEDIFIVFSRFAQLQWGFTKISVSQDTGEITTLSQSHLLKFTAQYYMTSTLAGNKLRLASTTNATLDPNAIHYWEIDITTGDVTDHQGNVHANINVLANLPIDISTVTPLLSHKSNYRRRLFYVRSAPMSPAIAFAEWLTAASSDGTYKVISLENGSWIERDYAQTGKAFNPTYFSGMAFPDPCVKDEVIVCRYDNATNQGVLERVINVDETMITIESERVDEDFLIRPIAPKNGGALCAVSQLYSYGATGTFSFESDVKFKFLK